MVELRKRPAPSAPPPPKAKKAKAAKKDVPQAPVADDAPKAVAAESSTSSKTGPPKVGDTITLEGFGGEIETNDGEKTTLAKLVDRSKAGVVLFTYPKASTPGCTTQVCLFRDSYEPLTATGLSIYGLSTDSPKANTTFRTKQNLPYPLLCDPSASLIGAIGFKKAPKGTTRAVFVIDKTGRVLAAEAGGPAPTVEVVKNVVAAMGGDTNAGGLKKAEDTAAKDKSAANTAADVADTNAGVD